MDRVLEGRFRVPCSMSTYVYLVPFIVFVVFHEIDKELRGWTFFRGTACPEHFLRGKKKLF